DVRRRAGRGGPPTASRSPSHRRGGGQGGRLPRGPRPPGRRTRPEINDRARPNPNPPVRQAPGNLVPRPRRGPPAPRPRRRPPRGDRAPIGRIGDGRSVEENQPSLAWLGGRRPRGNNQWI